MAPEQTMVERVARAVEEARCPGREGPYGLYNYSSYGAKKPHKVRDFRERRSFGKTVFESDDEQAARNVYDRLTREHVGRAAIAVLRQPDAIEAAAVRIMLAACAGLRDVRWSNEDEDVREHYRVLARAALAEDAGGTGGRDG